MEGTRASLAARVTSVAARRIAILLFALLLSTTLLVSFFDGYAPSFIFGLGGANDTLTLQTDQSIQSLKEPLATCGPAQFAPSRQTWLDSIARHSDLMEDKFTIVIQTYRRPKELKRTLTALLSSDIPSLHEIQVVWNDMSEPPPSDFKSANGTPVRYRLPKLNSLNNKLEIDKSLATQAVLLQDDDLYYSPEDLEFVFQTWRRFGKLRVTGALVRCAKRYDGDLEYAFCRSKEVTYSMVLTNLAFVHVSFLDFYSSNDPHMTEIRRYVDEVFNCEDIAMNFMASMLTCEGPLQVIGQEKYTSYKSSGISTRPGHNRHRNICMQKFEQVFEHMPLVEQTSFISRGLVNDPSRISKYGW